MAVPVDHLIGAPAVSIRDLATLPVLFGRAVAE
jgi:hypothetical protein